MPHCRKILQSLASIALLSLLPLTARAEEGDLERFNKAMHDFNQKYYSSSESDANQFFTKTVPEGVRKGVSNFFANLGEPVVAMTSLAEGDVNNAQIATHRFFYNLIYGYGGVDDSASAAGIIPKPREMGQVGCSYGLPEGPFMVLPFYGPVTVGDFVGSSLPLVAGYVVFGEAFFLLRASTHVASYMDDRNDGKTPPSGAETRQTGGTDAKAKEAAEEDYRRAKEVYLAERKAECARSQAP